MRRARVTGLFPGHDVFTVHSMGWDKKLSLGLVVMDVHKNQMPYYRAMQTELLAAVERVAPGEIIHVPGVPRLVD